MLQLTVAVATFLFLPLLSLNSDAAGISGVSVKIGSSAILKFPPAASFRRLIPGKNAQIFKVCNGKNNKTCGFWMLEKSKKKVASGPTSYNKATKKLTIKKIRKSDIGDYESLDKKTRYALYPLASGGAEGGGGGAAGGGHGAIVDYDYYIG